MVYTNPPFHKTLMEYPTTKNVYEVQTLKQGGHDSDQLYGQMPESEPCYNCVAAAGYSASLSLFSHLQMDK